MEEGWDAVYFSSKFVNAHGEHCYYGNRIDGIVKVPCQFWNQSNTMCWIGSRKLVIVGAARNRWKKSIWWKEQCHEPRSYYRRTCRDLLGTLRMALLVLFQTTRFPLFPCVISANNAPCSKWQWDAECELCLVFHKPLETDISICSTSHLLKKVMPRTW